MEVEWSLGLCDLRWRAVGDARFHLMGMAFSGELYITAFGGVYGSIVGR